MGEAAPYEMIELDKPRKLQFTFGVAKRFKEITGKQIQDVDEKATFEEVSTLLYLMLQVEDKELSLEQSDDLFHFSRMNYYVSVLNRLMVASTPEGEAPKEEPEPEPETTTGSNSGPSAEPASA